MADELMLSHSSTATYWKCHWRYYLTYVLRLPDRASLAMALGTAVHLGVERFWKSPLSPLAGLRESFTMADLTPEARAADPDALADGETMLSTYIREVSTTFHPTLVEAPFTIPIEGIFWTGVIDAADDDVHDLKTTAGKTINGKKPVFTPEYYDMQVTGYSLGYTALTGRRPRRLLLDVLTRTGKFRQYERALRMGEFLNLVRLTRDAIMRRSFEPTGLLNGSCQFCPFTEVCEFYVPT